MSDNGGLPIVLLKIEKKDNAINIDWAKGVNIALLSHALRLASLQLDNAIIAISLKKDESVIKVPDIFKHLRS